MNSSDIEAIRQTLLVTITRLRRQHNGVTIDDLYYGVNRLLDEVQRLTSENMQLVAELMDGKKNAEYNYTWYNVLDGTFTDTFRTTPEQAERDIEALSRCHPNFPHLKLLRYDCVTAPEFEFSHLMRVR